MRIHRWWLALVLALLTPWIGPHVDRYEPIGRVLLQVSADGPDRGFWVIASLLLALSYTVWLILLSGIVAWLSHRRRDHEGSNGHA